MENHAFEKVSTLDDFVTERADVIVNKLLGDYNKKGDYVINKKIIAELISMPKNKRSSFNNAIYCVSKGPTGQELIFEIVFKKNTKNAVASAQMNVLENVEKVNGYIINTLKTAVGKFTDDLTPDFVTKACKTFNIDQNLGPVKEKKDDEFEKSNFIEARMKLISALDNITQEDYNKIYEEYFNKRLALLKTLDSGFANQVLEIFNNEYSKVEKYFLLDNSGKKLTDYKSLNELLDKSFEDISGINPEYEEQEKLYRERILPILGMFAASAAQIEKFAEEKVENVVPKKEREQLKEALEDRQETKMSMETPVVKETRAIQQEVKQAKAAPVQQVFQENTIEPRVNMFKKAAATGVGGAAASVLNAYKSIYKNINETKNKILEESKVDRIEDSEVGDKGEEVISELETAALQNILLLDKFINKTPNSYIPINDVTFEKK